MAYDNSTEALTNEEIFKQIKDLSSTVDTLSTKLDDFIETASTVTGYGGTMPRPDQPYGEKGSPLDGNDVIIEADTEKFMYKPTPSELTTGSKVDFSEDENKERGNWSGRLDFLLSCLGYAVGLGNVWRFPHKAYTNGGGAFLVPYVIMLLFVGIPIFYLELSLGQFTSRGPLTCWKFAPMFQGIGWAMVFVSGVVGIYYNMIIAWSFFYLGSSFTALPNLPWSTCDPSWSKYCYTKMPNVNCTEEFVQAINGTCINGTNVIGVWNSTAAELNGIKRTPPSQDFFNRVMLDKSDSMYDIGGLRWQLAASLGAAWLLVFFCLCRGIKSSGKVVYFTAIFPYVLLIILLIRGLTLPGYQKGIEYYITPDWSQLKKAKVWQDAANQIFFSLSACWGGLITLSSYNRFHNNHLRDTFIVCLGNCITSVFAGFVIFSFLGFMAHELQTTVDKVTDSGTGLAFVVYPDAVSRMPVAPLWAILFFLMLITLGLDSQTVTTSLMDRWPRFFSRRNKTLVIFGVCAVFYAVGLVFCTRAGAYYVELLDSYTGGWAVLTVGLFECIALLWVYGWKRLSKDIGIMLGSRPNFLWRIFWDTLTPLIITFVLVFSWVDYTPPKLGEYIFPFSANVIGWIITCVIVIPIPFCIIIQFLVSRGSCGRRVLEMSSPTIEWGPYLPRHRRLVNYVSNFVIDLKRLKSRAYSDRSRDAASSKTSVRYENAAFDEGKKY